MASTRWAPGGFLLLVLAACGGGSGADGGNDPPPSAISFELDLQPILQADCIHCHGGAGGLDLESWAGLMAGGDSGPIVVPGDPDNSLLIQRLDGTILPTMPRDGPALSAPEIARFAQWISEGALDN